MHCEFISNCIQCTLFFFLIKAIASWMFMPVHQCSESFHPYCGYKSSGCFCLAPVLVSVSFWFLGNVSHGRIVLYCKQRIPVAQLERFHHGALQLVNRALQLWCQRLIVCGVARKDSWCSSRRSWCHWGSPQKPGPPGQSFCVIILL